MKSVKIFFISIILILFLFSNLYYSQSEASSNAIANAKPYLGKSTVTSSAKVITFEDNMNGDNSVAGLEARGWVVIDVDGGGNHPAWFQGNLFGDYFNAYEGTSNGYVASDWYGDTDFVIDHWLITPTITADIGDIFSYWVRSGSDWEDSLSIYILSDDKTDPTEFNFISKFLVDTLNWVQHGVEVTGIPADGKIRFAFRYNIDDIQIEGDYIGIDLIQMNSSSIGNLPTAITNAATNIGTTTATLNGIVNPNGLNTTYLFSYGTSTNYDNFEFSFTELTGNDPINVNVNISDLTPNTLYHFQLSADNSAGTINGDDVTFITASDGNPPPLVTTNAATSITSNSAVLNGTINPNNAETHYYFEYGVTSNYDQQTTMKTLSISNFETDVNETIIGLTVNTNYHYRLVAENDGGITLGDDETFYTNDITVLSPLVTTTSATNITSNSVRLNGTVNPNGDTTNFYFEYGTTTNYGNTVSNGIRYFGNTDFVANYDLSGLSPNTIYHYRIIAVNGGGTSHGNDISFTTNATSVTNVDLQWRTLSLLSFDWEIGSTINASLMVKNYGTDTAGPQRSQLFISTDSKIESSDIALGSPIQFPEIPAGDSVTVSSNFIVPSNTNGIYYIGAIVDVNNVISESDESNNGGSRKSKIIIGYPTTLQLNSSVNFTDASLSSSFRMVGLPGNVNQSISQLVSGSYNEDWVAYYDNGNTTNYLISYDGSNTFNFSPGKGFWILSKNNINVSQNVNVVMLENNLVSSGSYEIGYPITLHSGWNIISNPFESDVFWSTVQSYNQVTEPIHSFTGSFSTSSILKPYVGYYFYNATNLNTLHIPYFASSNLGKEVLSPNHTDLFLELAMVLKDDVKSSIIIGHNENSQDSYDKYDQYAPPGDFENIRITILNQQIETPYKFLKTDYRKLDKNQTFDLIIKKGKIDKLELKVKGVSSLSAEAIYLVDQNFTFHDLRSKESIMLKSTNEIISLQLLIGNSEFIDLNRELLIPKSISLSQNYPNPFNPTTTIEYTLPEKSAVQLKVFDILGKEITTLVNGEIIPGKYEVIFKGTELTSGVYFYTLRIGDFIETKKMVLLR